MRTRAVPGLAAAGGALLSAFAVAQEAAPPPDQAAMSPVRIMLAMKKAYAALGTYRDTGVVRTSSVSEGSRFGGEMPFKTAFSRPSTLRFEFVDTGLGERSARTVLWWAGAEVRAWIDAQGGERQAESIRQALEAAAGISGGASLRVPGYLLPDTVGAPPPLVGPERRPDAEEGGVACFRIAGRTRATPYTMTMGATAVTVDDETVTLWIERGTFLLRKVEDVKTMRAYRMTRTTVYAPEANVELAAADLAFP
jgi:hypothetical protein